MSLDQRLKGALERAADEIDPAVETQLAATIRRANTRRQSPLGLALVAAGVIVLALVGLRVFSVNNNGPAAATQSPSPSPTSIIDPSLISGSYAVTLDPADPGVTELGMAGRWAISLAESGALDVVPPEAFTGSRAEGHTFDLSSTEFRTDLYFNDYCDSVGTYEWALSDGQLTLTDTGDDCQIRRVLLSTRPLTLGE
jgi:hypothetical protein